MSKATTDTPESGRLTPRAMLVACLAVAAIVALQIVYAATADLRTDEAYYWTFSKENVLSYLDHPPMIAWIGTVSIARPPLAAIASGIPGRSDRASIGSTP